LQAAQTPPPQTPPAPTPPPNPQSSLAEAAKKAREAHASQPKASKTFNNDSIRKGTPDTTGSTDTTGTVAAKPATSNPGNTPTSLEEIYRAKFRQLRSYLRTAEIEDKRLREEMSGVGSNSAAALHPDYDSQRIQSLQSRIEANERKIAALRTQLNAMARARVTAKSSTSKPSETAAQEEAYRAKSSQLRNSLMAAEAEDRRWREEMSRVRANSAVVLPPESDPRTIPSRIDANDKKIAALKTQWDDLTKDLVAKGLPARWAAPELRKSEYEKATADERR
jgi:DNA repair exonuclease SbcCD ATPase subunit